MNADPKHEPAIASDLSCARMETPIGPLTIVATDVAVVAIWWDTEGEDRHPDARNPGASRLADPIRESIVGEHAVLDLAMMQLTEYFEGRRIEFDLPLDPVGTRFQHEAWAALRRIPFGETISYGQQAVMLGDRNKSRAVGAANGRNPIPIVVPCHRVVGSNGHLTGFAGGLEIKAWLLDHEFRMRSAG